MDNRAIEDLDDERISNKQNKQNNTKLFRTKKLIVMK